MLFYETWTFFIFYYFIKAKESEGNIILKL